MIITKTIYIITRVCPVVPYIRSLTTSLSLKTTMPDFTLFIPSEIFSIILFHLHQVDCIRCMIVCRRWYKLIPQYGRDVWTELEISEKSWPRFNNQYKNASERTSKKYLSFHVKIQTKYYDALKGKVVIF